MDRRFAFAFILFAFAAIFQGCSPKVVTQMHTEYQTVTDYQHDTLWRDREKVVRDKGDTVTIIEKEYIYKTLWKSRTDTVRVIDTLSVERVKEVKVEKKLSLVQKAKMRLFWILIAALAFAYRKQLLQLLKLIAKLI